VILRSLGSPAGPLAWQTQATRGADTYDPGSNRCVAKSGLVRVTVTRIEWDGTMRRRMVDAAQRGDGPQREDLATRALAVLPPTPRSREPPSTTSASMTV
jgi:hypothetical protein